MLCILTHLLVSHRFIRFCLLCLGLFFSSVFLRLSSLHRPILMFTDSFSCLWILLVNFSLQLLYFSSLEFLLVSFLGFLSVYQYFHFVHTLSSWHFRHLPLIFWSSLTQFIYNLYLIWGEVAHSCLTLCDPIDYSLPGSSVHGIFQARVLEWVAISFSSLSSISSINSFPSTLSVDLFFPWMSHIFLSLYALWYFCWTEVL